MNKSLLFLCLFILVNGFSQLNLDSLKTLASENEGPEKVEHLSTITNEFVSINLDSAKYYSELAKEYALETGDEEAISRANYTIGQVYFSQGKLEKSIEYHLKAIEVREILNIQELLSESYNSIGAVYSEMSEYEKATDYLFRAVKIQDEINIDEQKAEIYSNISILYYHQKQWPNAILYMQKCAQIDSTRGNKEGLGYSLSNLGAFYYMSDDNEKAIDCHNKALEIRKKLGNMLQIARSYNNLANVYSEIEDYDKAFTLYKRAIDIKISLGHYTEAAVSMTNIANTFNRVGKQKEALEFFKKSESILDTLGTQKMRLENYLGLSQTYENKGDFKNAYFYRVKHSKLEDSLFNETKNAQIAEFMAKYDAGQKELEITKLEKEKAISEAETERQTLQRNGLMVLAGLCIFIVLLTVKFLRDKQKANKELHHQRDEIATKNAEIIDSISYAKRIQKAILPSDDSLSKSFKENFILYMPKDIVAGDFYYVQKLEDSIIVAVADCTGHGVPGAMVSVVCHNGLNRAIREDKLTNPADILDRTRQIVVEEFQKSDAEVRDGMDIAIVNFKLDSKGKPVKVTYAGAHNPLYLVNQERTNWPEMFKPFADSSHAAEIKADKQPIGKFRDSKPFNSYSFDLVKGDQIYLFTDGYCDQFGGDKIGGKKFKSANFKKLLCQISGKEMASQKSRILAVHNEWKGEIEQIDDICIIGLKI